MTSTRLTPLSPKAVRLAAGFLLLAVVGLGACPGAPVPPVTAP